MKRFAAIGITLLILAIIAPAVHAVEPVIGSFKKLGKEDLKNIKADHWSIAGGNIVITGNVHIPYGDYDIYADKAIVNISSRDLDAQGNIRLARKMSETISVPADKIAEVENKSGVYTELQSVKTDLYGNQTVSVKCTYVNGEIKAQTFSGNLDTGFFSFSDAEISMANMVCRAKSGVRKPNGVVTVKEVELSACEYLKSENAHYSITCKEAELTPYDITHFGKQQAISQSGDYSIFGSNCTVRAYGIPVLWLPMFYKPKDENLGLFQVQAGKDSDWGYFVSVSKKFYPLDYPATSVRLLADYYEKRGFGYGASIFSSTENSKTSIFAYGIYDTHPNESSDAEQYNIKVPHQRYDFRISNVTHITPSLDFRGNLEIMSDEFVNYDFFNNYYTADPRPVTFAALENQFDLFTASVYFRPRLNKFFETVEQLPTGRLDIQRQEILNTNIYYQGETSAGYFQRKWAERDAIDDEKPLNSDAYEYHSFRFDTLHFFYYPINLSFINIIPRAGFRMTAYSNSSKAEVSEKDLSNMLLADSPEYIGQVEEFQEYDNKGGALVRFAGEFGLEVNTKIYSSWQDIRSNFFQIDGLRHVMIPYMNYTYIPEPSESRDNIYYFDDIDRIAEEHFIRLGLVNRLQTRNGDQLVNYMTMENYWDYHIYNQPGFNHIGDFCTKLSVTPFKGLTISTDVSIAAGGVDDDWTPERHDVYRNGRNVGHPGLYAKWLNRWSFVVKYEPAKDFIFNFSYQYQNRYRTQSVYSMGSSLTAIESGSAFNKFFSTQTQQLTFGFSFPITPDRRTFGKYSINYDFNVGFAPTQTFAIVRQFHCVEVAAELTLDTDTDSEDGKTTETSFYVTARLLGLMGPAAQEQSSVLSSARQMQSKDGGLF